MTRKSAVGITLALPMSTKDGGPNGPPSCPTARHHQEEHQMRTISKLTLAVAALVLTGTTLQAQTNNASITATASVQTPINVIGAQQLNFGNVFPGVNKTVAASDLTNGGRFDVTGQASTPVTLSFTLRSEERRVGKECRSRW